MAASSIYYTESQTVEGDGNAKGEGTSPPLHEGRLSRGHQCSRGSQCSMTSALAGARPGCYGEKGLMGGSADEGRRHAS